MEDFLKKHSAVPNGFIEDFFKIAKEEYIDNEPTIKFEIVVKWLKVQKGHLKRLLVANFDEGYDYDIERIKKITSHGATRVDIIILTPDCFKELCMLSQTPRAKEVRTYFLQVEKLIKKYYIDIKNNLLKEIGLLKTNQKPKLNPIGGIIYILLALNSDITLYKLGASEGLRGRLATYNSGNANDVEPLFSMRVDNLYAVEKCLKIILKKCQYRKRKEIYEIDFDVLKELIQDCDEFNRNMAKKIDVMEKKKVKENFKKIKNSENKVFMAMYPHDPPLFNIN